MIISLYINLGLLSCEKVYLLDIVNEDLGVFLEFFKGIICRIVEWGIWFLRIVNK